MIIPGTLTDAIGIGLIAVAYLWQRTNKIKGAVKQEEDL